MGRVSKIKAERQKERALAAVRSNSGKPRDWLAIGISIAVVALIAGVGIFIVVQNQKTAELTNVAASEVSPQNTINDGYTVTSTGIVKAEPYKVDTKFEASSYNSDETNIQMFIDYACPHCADFETANMSQMEQWLDSGEIGSITINPVVFLGEYSFSGANALACVAEYSPANVLEAHKALMDAQSTVPSGQKLVTLLTNTGVTKSDDFTKCVRGAEFGDFVMAATERAQTGPIPNTILGNAGITGTPSIFVNGEKYPGDPTPTVFADFVTYIKQGGTTAEIEAANNPSIGQNETEIGKE